MTPAQFAEWGRRVPFLLSIILLGVSIWIRLQLEELPAFARIKAEGKQSKTPRARPSAAGRTPRSLSSPCSAAPPDRLWSGTRASSMPCSS